MEGNFQQYDELLDMVRYIKNNVATKEDLCDLRDELKSDMSVLRSEVSEEIGKVRSEFKKEVDIAHIGHVNFRTEVNLRFDILEAVYSSWNDRQQHLEKVVYTHHPLSR